MLVFFEGAFFLLAVLSVALAEFWGRGQALGFWGVVTGLSLLSRSLVLGRLSRGLPEDRTDAQWRHAVADGWWHLNRLLFLGLVAFAVWWWLGADLTG